LEKETGIKFANTRPGEVTAAPEINRTSYWLEDYFQRDLNFPRRGGRLGQRAQGWV
jgi:hypothetical protein